jgi:hypothetical protein
MAYDPSRYEARRRGLMENYSATGAANTYANFLSRQGQARNFADLQEEYNKAAPQVVAGYGKRGLLTPNVRSGAFNKAMKEFAKNRIKNESRAQQDMAQGEQQYGLGMAQLGAGYRGSLADLEAEKAREIEQTASDLLRLRSGY